MTKHNCFYAILFFLLIALFFSTDIVAQTKKDFLQHRFDGFTKVITKDFTKKKLAALKSNLEQQGLFFLYSNLTYNQQKEITKITIFIKNKKSTTKVTFSDNGKPIPNIKVGETNGIAVVTLNTTFDFKFIEE